MAAVCRRVCGVTFLLGHRRAARGRGGEWREAVLDGVVAEPSARNGREQRIGGLAGVLGEPCPQDGDGGRGERGGPFLAALAEAADVGSGVEMDVAAGQADELGDPQPGLDGERRARRGRGGRPRARSGAASRALISAAVSQVTMSRS